MKVDVLGVRVDALTLPQAVDTAARLMRDSHPRYIVTPNAEILYAAARGEALRHSLNGADLCVADGIGVVRAAKKLGRPLPGRVPGVELALELLPLIAREGKRLFLLGGKPGIAEKAALNAQARAPGLVVCGARDGYFSGDDEVVRELAEAAPDVVFVCLGSPKQELFMARNLRAAGTALMLGLGGTIDILAGAAKRAPVFFQKAGLEWLYRLITHPSRIARAAALPRFMRAVGRQKKRERL